MTGFEILAALLLLGSAGKQPARSFAAQPAPRGGGGSPVPAPTPAPTAPAAPPAPVVPKPPALARAATVTPAPWPAVVPSNLPPWPSGWEADIPVRPAVSARAVQLLPELHKKGVGTYRTEQIEGRWVRFVAKLHGTKKAVEAFRPRGMMA